MMIRLTADDGHSLGCWIAAPEGPRRGGLVLLQEIFGLTDQLKEVATRYAALGYDVAIPALFDRVRRDLVIPFDDIDTARAAMLETGTDSALTDIDAAVQHLRRRGGRVAVLGFCWGGGLALAAAQRLEIAGAVSFYGTRLGQLLDQPLTTPFQGHFGLSDDHTPVDLVTRLAETWPDQAEVFFYEAGHAFANERRPEMFLPQAAALAHARAETFLEKVLS
ncbi:dienelactone hydrolase family protein [Pseudooceanicola sp. CBS1P-1]|uniref:Dienelactone hydrolase family protein n=1 Tax=Pseudooceanicola albus TaxID=2692189 RepID=A0A6L7G8P1_9RHOB|nr:MULTISPECIES: dienelactone hydrolase family protein [Pseudooceanicola]MBT9385790.1 dienelactone hydrolase family protein [Pseudooceanicola endophyticus]MXN20022.1 dienelactone hydrolase family protein [Pseudooceanicola albus]